MSRVALWCTQKTGAPISRSRTVPPPTPVTTAKKARVTKVCFFSAASIAPDIAKTAVPARFSQSRTGPRATGSGGTGGMDML